MVQKIVVSLLFIVCCVMYSQFQEARGAESNSCAPYRTASGGLPYTKQDAVADFGGQWEIQTIGCEYTLGTVDKKGALTILFDPAESCKPSPYQDFKMVPSLGKGSFLVPDKGSLFLIKGPVCVNVSCMLIPCSDEKIIRIGQKMMSRLP
ncbi:MAG: hypothetical protein Q7T03_10225 [Deltaproteobacteria bacterium]|nr:hypothetical protein [Deltaproteobacteria bacterium]